MAAQLIPVILFVPVMMGIAYLRMLRTQEVRRRHYQLQGQRVRVRLEIAERNARRVMSHAA